MILTNQNGIKHTKERLRQISVSETNYLSLKKEGTAGDSFNDVITELLKKSATAKTVD